jgi:uncharacterized membrane protein
MAVLIVLFGALLVYRDLGALGVPFFANWQDSARFALATMFAFTSVSHFAPMRKDLIAMGPPVFPRPDVIVLITGALELAGAVGLLITATRPWAAWGLIALMAGIFPANFHAARHGVKLRGRPPTVLWLRATKQILSIAWAW